MLVMIHCQGYAHPKPDDMTDAEHVEYHHEQLEHEQTLRELVEIVKRLIDIVENLQEKHKTTSNRLRQIEIEQELERKREEVSCNDFIAFLGVIGGIVFTTIIIKRGLKRRRQIKPR